MRHKLSGRQLSRNAPHRHAMLRNMAASLLRHETIRTTLPKAKELRRVVEPLITLAKIDSEAHRRLALARLRDTDGTDATGGRAGHCGSGRGACQGEARPQEDAGQERRRRYTQAQGRHGLIAIAAGRPRRWLRRRSSYGGGCAHRSLKCAKYPIESPVATLIALNYWLDCVRSGRLTYLPFWGFIDEHKACS